jgi:hypothetical protein
MNDIQPERKETVRFHVAADDYFGTLATIISLLTHFVEESNANDPGTKKALTIMEELIGELTFMQKEFVISKREGRS